MSTLNTVDYVIVFVFIAATISLPFVIGYRKRHGGFFALTFAGRELGFLSMALTMFLSENGSAQLTGLAGWAVESGLGIYAFELIGGFGLLTLGWIFMPVYMASGVLTTIDYANKRFGGKRIAIVMVILMLVINLVSKFSVELHTTHVMLDELYDVSRTAINVSLLLIAILVVYPGGLYSLVYTNNMQFIFFLVGIPVIFVFSYDKFTGWQEIRLRYQKSWPLTTIEHVSNGTSDEYTQCGIPDINSLDLIRNHNDPDLPWPGMVFGIYIISIYNFCIDQSILQFCLGGKSLVHAKYACIVHAFFKVFTIFLVIPGFIARVLYTDIVACADPDVCERTCGKRSSCADLAIPQLFDNLVPKGWRGPVLVAFMAATLTSLTATLHAGSTIFVINLYRPLRRTTSECECTIVGKIVVLVQATLGMVLEHAVDKIPHMHDFMRQIYATMVPPLVAVYFAAIFWDRVTEKIAFRTLVLGSCIAFIRLGWKLSYGFVPCGDEIQSAMPDIISNFHDLHFAIFLFVICMCHIILTGLVTDAINHVHLHRLIFWLRFDTQQRIHIDKIGRPFVKTKGAPLAKKSSITKSGKNNTTTAAVRDTSLKRSASDVFKDAFDEDTFQLQEPSEIAEEDEGRDSIHSQEMRDKEKKLNWFSLKCLSRRRLGDEELYEMEATRRTLVKELPSQTRTLAILQIVLLLVIVFVMGFFS